MPNGHDQLHFVVQLPGAGWIGQVGIAGHDGIGRLEEEHRVAALGLRRWRGGAHLAGVVGEVAAHAVDPAHGEAATALHGHARNGSSRE